MSFKFLVIGESCTDIFTYGCCERLSPEAPIPIFIPKFEKINEGMAMNVYNNLLAIKSKTSAQMVSNYIVSKNKAIKKRYVDYKTNHYFLRVDEKDDEYETIFFDDQSISLIKEADCIIISDYNKGFLRVSDIAYIKQCSKKNCIIFMDTKKIITDSLISFVDYVKVNEKEYEKNLQTLHEHKLIITLGAKGAKYRGKEYPSDKPQTTMDVSGAGDTFLAALAFMYMEMRNIEKAILFGNEISSVVVSKKGVSTI